MTDPSMGADQHSNPADKSASPPSPSSPPSPRRIQSVLIARGALGEIYEPAWVRALGELGVEVQLFDGHACTLPGILGRVERRFLWGPGMVRANRGLIDLVRRTRPDVTLLYQGHYYPAATIETLKQHTFVTGCHNDDPFGDRSHLLRYRHLLPALPHYQGYHVYRRENIAEAQAHGLDRVGLLLPYFIPWLDYPRHLTLQQSQRFGCDVVFAGHLEPDHRGACITRAVQRGIDMKVYGGERFWRRGLPGDVYAKVGPATLLGVADYRLAISGAKIATCFFSKWNRDQYTRRSFEIPAMGTFLLSERTEAMQEMFREGEEAAYFSSPEEFVDKIGYYLQNDSQRLRIAEKGRERVLAQGHDIHSRLKQWLKEVEQWCN
ncbi:MAG: glycosyltransferase [Magnetococcales bacterium]|nr:glycosyltransferase [Magnetococcales bacterium]